MTAHVCVHAVLGGLAVWRHNKTKKRNRFLFLFPLLELAVIHEYQGEGATLQKSVTRGKTAFIVNQS